MIGEAGGAPFGKGSGLPSVLPYFFLFSSPSNLSSSFLMMSSWVFKAPAASSSNRFSVSGEGYQDNDLVVIESPQAAARFHSLRARTATAA